MVCPFCFEIGFVKYTLQCFLDFVLKPFMAALHMLYHWKSIDYLDRKSVV